MLLKLKQSNGMPAWVNPKFVAGVLPTPTHGVTEVRLPGGDPIVINKDAEELAVTIATLQAQGGE